jgi:hypothetical protein
MNCTHHSTDRHTASTIPKDNGEMVVGLSLLMKLTSLKMDACGDFLNKMYIKSRVIYAMDMRLNTISFFGIRTIGHGTVGVQSFGGFSEKYPNKINYRLANGGANFCSRANF